MPKPVLKEVRDQFLGGLNRLTDEDQLAANELIVAGNVALATKLGAFGPRGGSKRTHSAQLDTGNDAPIVALKEWITPGGNRQQVAITCPDRNGSVGDMTLHWRNAGGAWTSAAMLVGTAKYEANQVSIAVMNVAGAVARMYILVDDDHFFEWTGSGAVTNLGTPESLFGEQGLVLLAWYHLRAFLAQSEFRLVSNSPGNEMVWSDLGNPTSASGTGPTGGGAGKITTQEGGLTSLTALGSSLMVSTRGAMARFTGYSDEDIQIAQDSEGVSSEIGIAAVHAAIPVEKALFGYSMDGPAVFNEVEGQLIAPKLRPIWAAAYLPDILTHGRCFVGHNEINRTIWFCIPTSASTQEVYVLSLDTGTWTGPYTFPFTITCFGMWHDSAVTKHFVAGCSDSYVRILDGVDLWKDDILSDGTGGSQYIVEAELTPFYFGEPDHLKSLFRFQASAAVDQRPVLLEYRWDDEAAWQSLSLVGASGADLTKALSYRLDAADDFQGEKLRVRVRGGTGVSSENYGWLFSGLRARAYDMLRET